MSEPQRKFLDTALTLFAERGLHGVSLSDVGRALGLTKQSVLYHFDTKNALYATVLSEVAERLNAMLDTVVEARIADAERVDIFIAALHAHLRIHPQDARLIARELIDNPERVETARTRPMDTFLNRAIKIMRTHPAARGVSEAHLCATTYQLIGAINYFVISAPTLNALWGAQKADAVRDVFLTVLQQTWGTQSHPQT